MEILKRNFSQSEPGLEQWKKHYKMLKSGSVGQESVCNLPGTQFAPRWDLRRSILTGGTIRNEIKHNEILLLKHLITIKILK